MISPTDDRDRLVAAIRIAYRHLAGCPRGDCPGHHATIRHTADVDRVLATLAQHHPERRVCIERVRTSDDPVVGAGSGAA